MGFTGDLVNSFRKHPHAITCVQFHPTCASMLLTLPLHSEVGIWDVESGECLRVLTSDGNGWKSAKFSPDGSSVLLVGSSERVDLISMHTSRHVVSLVGHDDWVVAAAFSPCGMFVVTTSHDNSARIWSV